ncbi:MAG: type I restriction enzyme M protein [Clostridium sp.]|jgi:type I restriction enzyme M protein
MLSSDIKSVIDKLWNNFWSGGISNPLSVIEQISYLLFIKRLDDMDNNKEKIANRTGKKYISIFPKDQMKWSTFKHFGVEKLFDIVSLEVFPFIKTYGGEESSFTEYMKDAIFMIPKPSLLQESVRLIDGINMDNSDTKGDLYEYLLSKLSVSGVNGQFRTPRHIIRMMVELMEPTIDDVICDPACGTAGFLVNSMEYILEKYTRKKSVFTDEDGIVHNRIGDMMEAEDWDRFKTKMFYGFDFDSSMLRIASMNLMLHGLDNPNIRYEDSLSKAYDEENKYTLILANPPFKGSIDKDDINKSLLKGANTTKTELLFLKLFNRMLDLGGRCAVIVPDGVLFGSSNAHKEIRKKLIEENELEAVISMPSGVFKPYAGVSTGILIFNKGGETNKVWFYDMKADGFSLDDKRNPIENNDIPNIIESFKKCRENKDIEAKSEDKWFWIDKENIVQNDYDLSINKYKMVNYEEVEYEKPEVILSKIEVLEIDILKDIAEIKGMVK